MKPPKLMSRILGALQLQPMTLRQLCTVLTSPYPYTRNMLEEMRQSGMVIGAGRLREGISGRPQSVYAVNSGVGGDPLHRPEAVPSFRNGPGRT